MTRKYQDDGFTLIELLMVVLVLGILSTVVAASVGGFASAADDSACAADANILATATEAFFADHDISVIPASGTSADRFEATLVAEGFLRMSSDFYDLDGTGHLVAVRPCAV